MTANVYQAFARQAQDQPDAPAVLGPGEADALSYAGLDAAVRSLDEPFARGGVRPGDCIGLHCPSGVDYIVSTCAAWRNRACVVPIPCELARPEKETILRTVALDFVISSPEASFLPPVQRGGAIGLGPNLALFPVRPLRQPPAGFRSINSAFVRFTSGTTADAKGVVLSHESILERIDAANEALHLGPGDRVVWLLSMAYHFAVSISGYLTRGAAVVLPANHFAQAVLAAARRWRATVIYGSPAHYAWLAGAPSAAPLPDLRLAVSTTSGLDRAGGQRFREVFGLPLTQALGIIEVGLPFINTDFADRRCDALGRLLPAYQMRLHDVGIGEGLGEIWLRGPGLLDAYYEPWQPRAALTRDGWFRTGDVAELDGDGCVVLCGRLKEVISVLGMKFFPREVEDVLTCHPGVADACVFGRPDPRLGEAPAARVVLRGPADETALRRELVELCRRHLASAKTPRDIEFVDALPRTASGKVLHRPTETGYAAR